MKKFLVLLFCVFMLSGCATWQGINFENTPVNNMSSYFAGKGVAIGISEFVKKETTIPALEERYKKFMVDIKGMDMVPPELSIALYNDMAMILSAEADDPYGLLADLTMVFREFGAQFAVGENKVMTGIDNIPWSMYDRFGLGWSQGRFVYLNNLED